MNTRNASRAAITIAVIIGFSEVTFAQEKLGLMPGIEKWQSEKKSYVTPAARRLLAKEIESLNTSTYVPAISQKDTAWLKEVYTGRFDKKSNDQYLQACIPAPGKNSCESETRTYASFQAVVNNLTFFFLQRYPVVRLVVEPVPPRDYKVNINDEDCPPTVEGIYKVPAGMVRVSITRAGKAACSWAGSLENGREQVVECKL